MEELAPQAAHVEAADTLLSNKQRIHFQLVTNEGRDGVFERVS